MKKKHTYEKKDRTYYLNHRDKILTKSRQWMLNNKDRFLHNQYMIKYGISYIEYCELSEKQNHICAICGLPETRKHSSGKLYALAVDHCHKTGIIRKLLCARCNKTLGLIKDSIAIVDKIKAYLVEHGDKSLKLNLE
jgi:hypothetical protein